MSQIVMWIFLRKLVDFLKVSAREVLLHLKPNIVLFIPVITTNLFKYVDKFMLGGLEQMIQLGFYENGEKLIQIPNSLVTTLGTVMLPRMSNLVKRGNREEALALIHRSMFLSIFMCLAMAFGLMGVAEIFVPFFFGNEFTPTREIVYILAPTMLFICWSDVIRI
ncbi:oligosaccharide flippase family protein [Enterococcus faecium]|nr:oligosaccharide flippase family protein [Enterococcus faecium]